ncbi:sulfite exporter TauE/SafE family protein [Comamonas aquatilis]|uniref:sulfite exporter TauE/SafE family protein n=1 Tax=Comamonas aquatilis TaxID=1778406 RepID=UPI0039F02471
MEIIVIIIGAALAGFVQGLSGFGYSMTAMALWAWTLEPTLAAVLAVFGGLTGQIIQAFSVRRGFGWRALWPFLLGGLAGLPLGLMLLPRLDVQLFKTVLGTLLVVFCPLMAFAHKLPRLSDWRYMQGPLRPVSNALAGMAGGAMSALGGFSGVVPTLWCQLGGMAKDAQRQIIQNFNLTMLAVTFASYLGSGLVSSSMLPLFAVALPAMLLPSIWGGRLYHRISDQAFRRVVLGLLTLAGLAMLASGIR